jgi:hypothetical protein
VRGERDVHLPYDVWKHSLTRPTGIQFSIPLPHCHPLYSTLEGLIRSADNVLSRVFRSVFY